MVDGGWWISNCIICRLFRHVVHVPEVHLQTCHDGHKFLTTSVIGYVKGNLLVSVLLSQI